MENDVRERRVIELIATDRISIPVRSMGNKLYKTRPKLAEAIGLAEGESFDGERVYARVSSEDTMKARGMKEGIAKFTEEFPRHGKILSGYIEEQRALSETHCFFGVYEGKRLTADDYIGVMTGMGFTETTARKLYPELMDISRKLSKKRGEVERSVLIGKGLQEADDSE